MRVNLAVLSLMGGAGMAAATGMDIAREGLDGLSLLLLIISSLLVYNGGKGLTRE